MTMVTLPLRAPDRIAWGEEREEAEVLTLQGVLEDAHTVEQSSLQHPSGGRLRREMGRVAGKSCVGYHRRVSSYVCSRGRMPRWNRSVREMDADPSLSDWGLGLTAYVHDVRVRIDRGSDQRSC